MIAKDILQRQEVFRICANSAPIHPGDRFGAVANEELHQKAHGTTLTDIICRGAVNEKEMLFSAKGGRYYFSLVDGWGVKGGTLYGLELGLFFDFKHPTTSETIVEECECRYGNYSTWCGAMAAHHRRSMLDAIISVEAASVF